MNRSPLTRKTPMNRGKLLAAVARERARPALKLVDKPAPRPVVKAVRPPAPQPKEGIHSSEAWRRHVAAIPCVFCGAPAQAAHRNEGKGMGMKTDDCLTAALCPEHHSAIDQGKDMTREQRRAEIDRAIVLTLRELVRTGKVVPK